MSNPAPAGSGNKALAAFLKAKATAPLPIGTVVEMTEDALTQFPRYRGRRGKIVGYSGELSPKVLWEGRKTASGYASWYIRRAGKNK